MLSDIEHCLYPICIFCWHCCSVQKASQPTPDSELTPEELAKRLRNRKKKAQRKAKKIKKQKAAMGPSGPEDELQVSCIINKVERRPAGKGRGQGLFATSAISKGQVVVRTRPALSTIFDQFVGNVCGFCFKAVGSIEHTFKLQKKDGRVGIDVAERNVNGKVRPVFAAFADGSANASSGIVPGDVVLSVGDTPITVGPGSRDQCVKLIRDAGPAFSVTVQRPDLTVCQYCSRVALCQACTQAGCGKWHRNSQECSSFINLPASVKKGESSPIRMMLRYKATLDHGDWAPTCPSGNKEPLEMVKTLIANQDAASGRQLDALAKVTGVPPKMVSLLIGQIRGNAASVHRNGSKVGCALSVHMGYTNHDCNPNAVACVDDSGFVTLTALSSIKPNEEILISYVDVKANFEQRRAILLSHYEFECKCDRCVKEHRAWLKSRIKNRNR